MNSTQTSVLTHTVSVNVNAKSRPDKQPCSVRWRLPPRQDEATRSVRTLDLVIQRSTTDAMPDMDPSWQRSSLDLEQLHQIISTRLPATTSKEKSFAAFKIILPQKRGYWVRDNIIQQRFVDSDVEWVRDLAHARQLYEPMTSEDISACALSDLLDKAVGILQLHESASLPNLDQEFSELEREVENRLSLPLLLSDPIPRYRLAMLHGRYNFKMTETLYQAALEMGIEMYVFAEPNHWFQEESYARYRKAYIPIDIQRVDDSLGQRVVDALQERQIEVDGIVALTDKWLIPAAQAAITLGLPSESVRLYEVCRDKYLTRQLDQPRDFTSKCVAGLKGAESWLEERRGLGNTLTYPLIVKPCAGWASEGVRKVFNEQELLGAVAKANLNDYSHGDLVTIETYIDGPEFDANFIMWDGEPLFFEISDQFPSEADLDTATSTTNFPETELFLPSALPTKSRPRSKIRCLKYCGNWAAATEFITWKVGCATRLWNTA